MRIKLHPAHRGFVTLVVLVVLIIMLAFVTFNRASVIRLRREIHLVETRQIARARAATNAPVMAPAPGGKASR